MKEEKSSTMSDTLPPYIQQAPDIDIPIPNTQSRLPLSWSHARAIRKLMRFFGRLYRHMQQQENGEGLDRCRAWMMTLYQMDTSIRDGKANQRW